MKSTKDPSVRNLISTIEVLHDDGATGPALEPELSDFGWLDQRISRTENKNRGSKTN